MAEEEKGCYSFVKRSHNHRKDSNGRQGLNKAEYREKKNLKRLKDYFFPCSFLEKF